MRQEQNSTELILSNDEYYAWLLRDIKHAKTKIDLEVYIFNNDIVGETIAQALAKASMRGVKVRVLVDGIGSLFWGGSLVTLLNQAGVRTRVYHPLPWFISHWWKTALPPSAFITKIIQLCAKINSRNHRKTVNIDNKIIYIGSSNIANCHQPLQKGGEGWRDTIVRLTHLDTTDLAYAFNLAWGNVSFKQRMQSAFLLKNADPIIRLNYAWRQRRIQYKYLLLRIARCKRRIWVTNSYFIPDDKLLNRLVKAAKKGIDVRILLPSKSDVFVMPFVSTTFYRQLLKSGVLIYEYLPSFLHAKILILDDWYSVGSSNLNSRSLIHDLEVDITLKTSGAKQKLEKQFLLDLSQSKPIFLDDLQKQSIFKRIIGRLLLFIKYWL